MAMKPISLDNLTRAINKLKDFFVQIKDAVKSVNGAEPDANGDIEIDRVDWAGELESSSTQSSRETFTIRATGGHASVSDGNAWLMDIHGNSVKTGFVEEVLDLTVEAIPRQDESEPITATIDAETFWPAVASGAASGTIVMTYTTVWSTNPATLGITVTGTPIAGDQIVVDYVKGNRGTITNATPGSFVSTGWNLYDHAAGCARVVRYSDDNGYRIDGAYTAPLLFSETPDGAQTELTVTSGLFQLPDGAESGYVWVTGGNSTTTAIYPTQEDWTEGHAGSFQAFTSDSIDLSTVVSAVFEFGMCSVGTTYDEINLNIGAAISRIQQMEYNSTNLEMAIESGRDYDTDENYIYLVRAEPQQTPVSINGAYTANDHGLEWFTGSSVDVFAQTIYGASLKNKLERDVLTISQQTLTSGEKTQVQTNLGVKVANNLTTTAEGSVLDARQGKALSDRMVYKPGDTFTFNGGLTPCRTLNDLSGLYFQYRTPKNISNAVTGFTISVTSNSNIWGVGGGYIAAGATASNKAQSTGGIAFSFSPASTITAAGAGICSLNATVTFT